MKRILASLTLCVALLPSAAAALPWSAEEQIKFMLGRVAFLTAEAANGIGCAIATNKTVVKVGEPYELIWNSYGTTEGPDQYAPRGIQTMVMDTAGTFRYKMTFLGESGRTTTCTASISIQR